MLPDEAIAPDRTTSQAARVMLRAALTQRLGLRAKLVDREKRLYNLVRGNGAVKLEPSAEVETDTSYHQVGVFKRKSGSMADLAEFLSMLSGVEVLDQTGIATRYRFNEDWSRDVTGPWGRNPDVAFGVVKRLGLKLVEGKRMHKVLVVERGNVEPTPN